MGVNWSGNAAARNRAREQKKAGKGKQQQEDDENDCGNESDDGKDNAIDMRREDAELEKILRDYNNEARTGKKREEILDKPLDLPFYKRIQLPTHLKWVSIYSVKESLV